MWGGRPRESVESSAQLPSLQLGLLRLQLVLLCRELSLPSLVARLLSLQVILPSLRLSSLGNQFVLMFIACLPKPCALPPHTPPGTSVRCAQANIFVVLCTASWAVIFADFNICVTCGFLVCQVSGFKCTTAHRSLPPSLPRFARVGSLCLLAAARSARYRGSGQNPRGPLLEQKHNHSNNT